MPRKMPKQQPGTSEQTVGTPQVFIDAVERDFGPLWWDLAAVSTNKKAPRYLGPDQEYIPHRDSLTVQWSTLNVKYANNWLNPPFSKIGPWARKCAIETRVYPMRICMLVPASIGANWYDQWVTPFADVYSVGRMKFEGHGQGYPKDLILAHYWKLGGHKLKRWRWEK